LKLIDISGGVFSNILALAFFCVDIAYTAFPDGVPCAIKGGGGLFQQWTQYLYFLL